MIYPVPVEQLSVLVQFNDFVKKKVIQFSSPPYIVVAVSCDDHSVLVGEMNIGNVTGIQKLVYGVHRIAVFDKVFCRFVVVNGFGVSQVNVIVHRFDVLHCIIYELIDGERILVVFQSMHGEPLP